MFFPSDTRPRRGSALLAVLMLVFVLIGISGVLLSTGMSRHRAAEQRRDLIEAQSAAEDGLTFALAGVEAGRNPQTDAAIQIDYGFAGFQFRSLAGTDLLAGASRHYVNVYPGDIDGLDNDGNGTTDDIEERAYMLIDSLGVAGPGDSGVRVLRATAVQIILPFRNAIYAGNSSGSLSYNLPLGGNSSSSGDDVIGNVYSAGNTTVSGYADVQGMVRAGDTATRTGSATVSGVVASGVYQPLVPLYDRGSFSGMPEFHEVRASTYSGDPIARQIFQKNPTGSAAPAYDRSAQVTGTALNDFFLEEWMPSSTVPGGTSHTTLRLHASGNQMIYYVDGNLWLNSRRTYGFDIQTTSGAPVKVTFVVAGNVYLSDNLYYKNPASLVSFLAIENPSLPASNRKTESGNIVVGDPIFGTLEDFSGLLYAQNDFIDNNLTAAGSQSFIIRGAMTARNQVNIARDYLDSRGRLQHSKMTVTHDARVFDPNFELSPGIAGLVGPRSDGDGLRLMAVNRISTGDFEARTTWTDLPVRNFGTTRGADQSGN